MATIERGIMYSSIKKLKKFTTRDEIDTMIGEPKFRLGKRLVYYYGKGILIAYAKKCFKVDGCERIEYGEEGKYAVSIYHFVDKEFLKEYFDLDSLEEIDIQEFTKGIIDEEIDYNKTFSDIHKLGLDKKYINHYREGENCILVNGTMKVLNLFIMYGSYTLFFRGGSKKNKLSGFQYTLCE